MTTHTATKPAYAKVNPAKYTQNGVKARLRAMFLDHVGEVITNTQCKAVAAGAENWHQRLSELRCEEGYFILSDRDRPDVLKAGEYLMPHTRQRPTAAKRVRPDKATWAAVLERSGARCEWHADGQACQLAEGTIDPIGGGTVRLQADHKTPHSVDAASDPTNPDAWASLCGRHQVTKKNFWDDTTGEVNIRAILQAAPVTRKVDAIREGLTMVAGRIPAEDLIALLEAATPEQQQAVHAHLAAKLA